MAFDGITIANIVTELNRTITGGKINKIAQPENDELLITVKNQKNQYRLFISASASLPLIYLTDTNKPSPLTAPNFCMLLRKHIGGGRIVDIRFPEVDPGWTNAQVNAEAERICGEIDQYNAAAVMCQGEFTLTYAIISRLKEKGITVLAACSRRRTEEIINDDGSTQKKALYSFEGFREF